MNKSTTARKGFNYNGLAEKSTRATLKSEAVAIKAAVKRSHDNLIEIGNRLNHAKELLDHGLFMEWIDGEFQMEYRTAKRFMEVSEAFGKIDIMSNLTLPQTALYALAAPSVPEIVRVEAIEAAKSGEIKTVADTKAFIESKKVAAAPPPPADDDLDEDPFAEDDEPDFSAAPAEEGSGDEWNHDFGDDDFADESETEDTEPEARQVVYLDPSRFEEKGDVERSYSAQSIAEKKGSPVDYPFTHDGQLYVSVGRDDETDVEICFKLVPASEFEGPTYAYPGRLQQQSYHGIQVIWKSKAYVLSGPAIDFAPLPQTEAEPEKSKPLTPEEIIDAMPLFQALRMYGHKGHLFRQQALIWYSCQTAIRGLRAKGAHWRYTTGPLTDALETIGRFAEPADWEGCAHCKGSGRVGANADPCSCKGGFTVHRGEGVNADVVKAHAEELARANA